MCATRSVPDIYSKHILHMLNRLFNLYKTLQILYNPHFEDEERKEQLLNKGRTGDW